MESHQTAKVRRLSDYRGTFPGCNCSHAEEQRWVWVVTELRAAAAAFRVAPRMDSRAFAWCWATILRVQLHKTPTLKK